MSFPLTFLGLTTSSTFFSTNGCTSTCFLSLKLPAKVLAAFNKFSYVQSVIDELTSNSPLIIRIAAPFTFDTFAVDNLPECSLRTSFVVFSIYTSAKSPPVDNATSRISFAKVSLIPNISLCIILINNTSYIQ